MGVTNLDQYREQREIEDAPHIAGTAVCLGCRHEWAAVSPVGAVDQLQCPSCDTLRGVYKSTPAPDQRFVCTCGCDVNYATDDGVMCVYCGTTTGYDELAET